MKNEIIIIIIIIHRHSVPSPNFRRVRRIAISDYFLRHVCLSVRPSVRMEQLGSHWADLREI